MKLAIDFLKKWFSGFNIFDGAVIGKWLFYAVVYLVFTTAYHHFNPAPPTQSQPITAQTIEKIINEAPQPENKKKFSLGVGLFGWFLGVSKE